jgi:flagellar basal body-associated protein FliL
LRKTKGILIFIFGLIVISAIGYGIFLYFYVQKRYSESLVNKTELVSESQSESELQSEIDLNSNLVEFLDNPIDLLEFKKKKVIEFTTSVTSETEYYYQPKIKDSIFCVYYYPDFKID